ncbi:ketopantoate reductase family protein [Roseomonas marmotae]|uniref:2-dehydropantoate 2-reductase n=1 Tax=Roseomonas marmotae TaxID=2768161 RepID=A0ABS3KBA5_9PROT|nr:2-dehydropantoate 2-reductase [Roseomonas marmotae]MBO1074741.1 2-dehydropantoate 2-reductase [Roseomonas marmotae]QTI77798.1 2-dehydropantoate 2-reductase [Roseomonas marmotae]
MKICVFGAGAIGGHVAARLALGGADVSVVARGAYRDAIAAKGLTISGNGGTYHVTPRVGSPAELGVQDAVIVTVKAPALPGVAEAIGPLLGPDTTVVFVMNGVQWWYFDRHGGPLDGRRLPEIDPGEAVRKAVGIERTLGGVVYSACTVTEPGHIHVETASNRIILGELDGSVSPRAEAIAAALEKGGMGGVVTREIRKELWAKLAANLAFGPFAILSRAGAGTCTRDPVVRAAMVRAMKEVLTIAEALGQRADLDPEKRVAAISSSNHKASILQDLELGRPMEIAAMFRVPLELARLVEVETPTLDLSVALATMQARAAGLYNPPA